MEVGLHFFKHRKRVLYVSATKPVRHPAGQVFSDGITAILQAVEATPRLKRPELATKILGEQQDTPEATARKEQLAGNLHYLIHAGHVIEFSNGILELPLAPQEKPNPERPAKPAANENAAETVDESSAPEATEEDSAPSADAETVVTSQPVEILSAAVEAVAADATPESTSTTESPSSPPEEPHDPSPAP